MLPRASRATTEPIESILTPPVSDGGTSGALEAAQSNTWTMDCRFATNPSAWRGACAIACGSMKTATAGSSPGGAPITAAMSSLGGSVRIVAVIVSVSQRRHASDGCGPANVTQPDIVSSWKTDRTSLKNIRVSESSASPSSWVCGRCPCFATVRSMDLNAGTKLQYHSTWSLRTAKRLAAYAE